MRNRKTEAAVPAFIGATMIALAAVTMFGLSSANAAEMMYPKEFAALATMPAAAQAPDGIKGFRPLVALRFPVAISDQDMEAARLAYSSKYARGLKLTDDAGINLRALDLLLIKTAYHVQELRTCVVAHTADVSDIVLDPYEIVRINGRFQDRDRSLLIPPSVSIDFYAGTAPASSSYTTFGPRYLPVFSISMAPQALPLTQGALAGPGEQNALLSVNPAYTDSDARGGLRVSLSDFINAEPHSSGFKKPWRKLPLSSGFPESSLASGGVWESGKYLGLPIEARDLQLDETGASGRPEGEECAVISNLIRAAAAHLSKAPESEGRRFASYAAAFSVDNAVGTDSLNVTEEERANTLRSFYAAEVRFLQESDNRRAQAILSGSGADAFHAARAEEAKVYGRSKGKMALLGVLTVVTLGAAGSAAKGGDTVGSQGAMDVLDTAGNTTFQSIRDDMSKLNDPNADLGEFLVDTGLEGQQISATSSAELREKLLKLYQDRYTTATVAQPQVEAH